MERNTEGRTLGRPHPTTTPARRPRLDTETLTGPRLRSSRGHDGHTVWTQTSWALTVSLGAQTSVTVDHSDRTTRPGWSRRREPRHDPCASDRPSKWLGLKEDFHPTSVTNVPEDGYNEERGTLSPDGVREFRSRDNQELRNRGDLRPGRGVVSRTEEVIPSVPG